jgi:hypothetical protein
MTDFNDLALENAFSQASVVYVPKDASANWGCAEYVVRQFLSMVYMGFRRVDDMGVEDRGCRHQ